VLGLLVETEDGQPLGQVCDVLHTGSNGVLVLQGPDGEVLIPMVEHVVRDVDLQAGRMRVRLPAGLLD
jgi:16S rRNA processing protein RimM